VEVAGSKVVINFGCCLTLPYSRGYSQFLYQKTGTSCVLAIGEVESIGSRYLEMQFAIGTLGMLAKRKTNSVLMRCNLDCSVFLGTFSWGEHGYGNTTFKGSTG